MSLTKKLQLKYKWYSCFKCGEMSLKEEPWSVFQQSKNDGKFHPAINEYHYQVIDEIPKVTGLFWTSCQLMLPDDLKMKIAFILCVLRKDKKNEKVCVL